jgi:hypothetical protein
MRHTTRDRNNRLRKKKIRNRLEQKAKQARRLRRAASA